MYDYDRNIYILEKYYIKVEKWGNLSDFFKNPNITSIPKNVYNKFIFKNIPLLFLILFSSNVLFISN